MKTKIGMVNFINTAPINNIWNRRPHPADWQLWQRTPAELNKMLAQGELDIAFISSYEYASRPEKYRILSDISISANGSVGSVFLFSKTELSNLNKKNILLSSQSDTSVGLVKIILEEFSNLTPVYHKGKASEGMSAEFDAVMAIGDEALRLVEEGFYKHKYDLGEIWHQHTGMSFVFAVCAVREAFIMKNEEEVGLVHREFMTCCHKGKEELKEICQEVAPRIPMTADKCYKYMQGIEYDLGNDKLIALEEFFKLLIKRGSASRDSLPLKIHSLPEVLYNE